MNLVDAFLILIIILAVWSGYHKGFILGFLDIIGWLGSLVLTFMYYPYAARWLEKFLTPGSVWTIPLAFIITFIVFRIIAGVIINFILGALPAEAHTNFIN